MLWMLFICTRCCTHCRLVSHWSCSLWADLLPCRMVLWFPLKKSSSPIIPTGGPFVCECTSEVGCVVWCARSAVFHPELNKVSHQIEFFKRLQNHTQPETFTLKVIYDGDTIAYSSHILAFGQSQTQMVSQFHSMRNQQHPESFLSLRSTCPIALLVSILIQAGWRGRHRFQVGLFHAVLPV